MNDGCQQKPEGDCAPRLTNEEKSRILAEEIFRAEVCRDLKSKVYVKKSTKERAWATLNSSFVLWALSSIVLSGLTASYAAYQNHHAEVEAKAVTVKKLDDEISNRIYQALGGLRTDEANVENGQYYDPRDIYASITYYLNNKFTSTDNTVYPEFSIFPEYKDRDFRSLITELYDMVDTSEKLELRDALIAYEQIADKGSIESNSQHESASKEQLVGVISSLRQIVNTHILKGRWKRDDLYLP